MPGIKYQHALDEQGRLLSIKQAYIERDLSHQYRCLGCGGRMIARLGEVRNWHFAHHCDDAACNTETYLHLLAKRLIKEKFENDSSFEVGYHRDVVCSDISSCPFANKELCHVHKLEEFDLKKYYDTCLEEQFVGDYVADLLLTNSTKPDREPILIEIQITHKSVSQKRDSGLHIIEIRIKSEDDIQTLLSAPIVENPSAPYGMVRDVETIGFGKFYGFKKVSSAPERLQQRCLPRFYLFRSGKAFVTNMEDYKPCRDVWKKDNEKAIFEASIDCSYFGEVSPYEYGYAAARQNGIEVKTCQFCKYHRNGFDQPMGESPIFCCLYQKYGTPKEPEPQYAKGCSYYREDSNLISRIYETMPPIVVASSR